MLYTEKEKHEIERVKEVFAEHLRQSPDFELLWSDKVGYVWLTIGVNPVYVDTGIRIESAADLCYRCLDDVATDVLYMTGNDHALEAADPLELAEIKRRWEPYINQLPDYQADTAISLLAVNARLPIVRRKQEYRKGIKISNFFVTKFRFLRLTYEAEGGDDKYGL